MATNKRLISLILRLSVQEKLLRQAHSHDPHQWITSPRVQILPSTVQKEKIRIWHLQAKLLHGVRSRNLRQRHCLRHHDIGPDLRHGKLPLRYHHITELEGRQYTGDELVGWVLFFYGVLGWRAWGSLCAGGVTGGDYEGGDSQ